MDIQAVQVLLVATTVAMLGGLAQGCDHGDTSAVSCGKTQFLAVLGQIVLYFQSVVSQVW